jgi:hypothetical protein
MNKDNLFVLKPIDKYEPLHTNKAHAFNPDPNIKFKKKFPGTAKSHAE